MAWTWDAGPQCGIAGERRLARRRAAAALRSGAASTAELQQVAIDTEAVDPDGWYVPVRGNRLVGRRDGAGVRWEPAPAGSC